MFVAIYPIASAPNEGHNHCLFPYPKMLQKLDALRSIFHVSCTALLLLFLPEKMLREEGGKEAWQSRKKR